MNNKLKIIEIIEIIKNKDWKLMLRLIPEGIEYKCYKYKTEEDFEEWDTYDNFVRYIKPAQDILIEKCLDKVLELLK